MSDHGPPFRLAVFTVGIPNAGLRALKYLILEMNLVQRSIEFEVIPTPNTRLFPALDTVASGRSIDRRGLRREFFTLAEDFDSYYLERASGYKIKDQALPNRYVMVSSAHLSDDYYATRTDRISLLALHHWKREMAPPSLVEFILILLLREAAATAGREVSGSMHLGTRGCLLDFTADLDDVRYKVLTGFVCRTCSDRLIKLTSPEFVDDLRLLAKKDWIGLPGELGSPAHTAALLGHNLFLNRAIAPSAWETLRSTVQQAWVGHLLTLGATVVGAALLAYLGLR